MIHVLKLKGNKFSSFESSYDNWNLKWTFRNANWIFIAKSIKDQFKKVAITAEKADH